MSMPRFWMGLHDNMVLFIQNLFQNPQVSALRPFIFLYLSWLSLNELILPITCAQLGPAGPQAGMLMKPVPGWNVMRFSSGSSHCWVTLATAAWQMSCLWFLMALAKISGAVKSALVWCQLWNKPSHCLWDTCQGWLRCLYCCAGLRKMSWRSPRMHPVRPCSCLAFAGLMLVWLTPGQ